MIKITEEPQPFPLEKILTVSVRDYCDSVDRSIGSFQMRGVHVVSISTNNGRDLDHLKHFAQQLPANTEVVVEYRLMRITEGIEGNFFYQSGTALIPK